MFLLRVSLTSLAVATAAVALPRDPADLASAPARASASVPAPVHAEGPARGIDVSHHQGTIDWRAVEADGVRFAFVKASEGTTFTDPAFRGNWAVLGETHILRGAYHRFRPRQDAAAQAAHFLAVAPVREGSLPPVLDVEATEGVSDARLVRGVRTWLAEVERRTGVRPVVYTKPGFRRAHLGTALDDHALWIAQYGERAPSERWTFWQHSERGRVAGIAREVDLDRFNGSHDELAALGPARGEARLAER